MKVKIKLAKLHYIELITYIAHLNKYDYDLTYIDKVNIQTLYKDAFNKYNRWKDEKHYYTGIHENTISIELNLFGTLQKIFPQIKREGYEKNLLHIIINQSTPQIEHYIFINQL